MDVHGVLHDDRHLGLQLCVPDAFLKEPCGDGKEPSSASFFWACPPPPKYSFGQVGDTLICPLQNTVPPQTTVCSYQREDLLGTELLKRGQNSRFSSRTLTPGPTATKRQCQRGSLQDSVWKRNPRKDHLTRAGPVPGSSGLGPKGLSSGTEAGPWREALLLRWLTSARILSSFSLFRTLELSPCSRLLKAASASRSRLSRSMRTFTSAWMAGQARGKLSPGSSRPLPESLE